MSVEEQTRKNKMRTRQILGVIHRLVEVIARGILLLIAYIRGPAHSQPPIKDLTLLHSATTLALKIRNRQLTSEDVVSSYIERIKEVQPLLNCTVADLFEEALKEARKCDDLLKSQDAPSVEVLAKEKPLFGVPFTTKDCIGVANMQQTAGLYVRKNCVAERDAEAIKLMRSAGAIPLALTNVSELAMWWESSNCLFGTTKNPYNNRHIVGGSSGGEGCILAAAGSPLGIGSDIGGSIRMPAFFNGIFGHKPSKGIVSNDGQYPSAHSDDQDQLLAIGPMCRYAQDLPVTLKILTNKTSDLLKLDQKVDMSRIKIYYMEDDGGQHLVSPVDPEIKNAMKRVLNYFEKAHKVKATKLNVKKLKKSLGLWLANMTCKDDKDFSYELTNRQGRLNIWLEFIKWMLFMSNHTLVALITAAFEKFGMKHGSEQHVRLMQQSKDLFQEFKDILGEDGIFLYPTHPTAAPMHHEPMFKPFNFSYTAIINVLGLPATACPLGLNKQGLPIGLQVVAGLYQDHLTLAVAEELERGFGGWVPPPIVA
ncbi:fatty-acid amide hydrolase 2-B isoform X2 [Ooceraea biroi]|nr:fatty-acid amide hydrolase 2-B isoform X2 [Ooceraea biroi]XP_026823850.1 fatty-acid amide hydrolase 2-B isoform X2 [Ooceraea biroi]XP_026823861.1 fatty-acid amide hydrolase 2-B isoform X2 [Ooceraea biroi]